MSVSLLFKRERVNEGVDYMLGLSIVMVISGTKT